MTYDNLIILGQAGWELLTIWWPIFPTVLIFAWWEKLHEKRPS